MKQLKVLFICRIDERADYDTAEKMAATVGNVNQEDLVCDYVHIEDLLFTYDGKNMLVLKGSDRTDIASYDFVFFLGWFKTRQLEEIAHSAAVYLDRKGVPFINSELINNRSRSKISQYVLAALEGLPCTMPFVYSMNFEVLLQYVGENPSIVGLPFIAKNPFASRGNDNFLLHSIEEFSGVQTHTEKTLVVQPWIPNDGDYRLLVFGNEVKLAIKRRSVDGSHTNNTSKGGEAVLEDISTLNPEMLADALKIAKMLRREVTGVDMIVHSETGKYYFLEGNNMPQLSTGVFTAEKGAVIGDFIRGRVGEK